MPLSTTPSWDTWFDRARESVPDLATVATATPTDVINVVIAVLGLVMTSLGAWFAYLALIPSRRVINYDDRNRYSLLTQAAGGSLRIFWRPEAAPEPGKQLSSPYVAECRLHCKGRSDVTREDFQGPIKITFNQEIIAVLTPEALHHQLVNRNDQEPNRILEIIPQVLRAGAKYKLALLLDGDRAALRTELSGNLGNTDLVGRQEAQVAGFRKRTFAAYLVAAAFAVAGTGTGLGLFGEPNTLAAVALLASAVAPLSLGLVLSTRPR